MGARTRAATADGSGAAGTPAPAADPEPPGVRDAAVTLIRAFRDLLDAAERELTVETSPFAERPFRLRVTSFGDDR